MSTWLAKYGDAPAYATISHDEQCRVAIDVELANGNSRRDRIINPPLQTSEALLNRPRITL